VISLYNILKEVISPTQEYSELVNDIVDQGGEYIGEGDYGVVFLVGDKVMKVTTDSEELRCTANKRTKDQILCIHIRCRG